LLLITASSAMEDADEGDNGETTDSNSGGGGDDDDDDDAARANTNTAGENARLRNEPIIARKTTAEEMRDFLITILLYH
jgi:hypothetical protein